MAGSAAKDRLIYPLQKRVVNPIVMLAHNLGIPPPGDALLETTGRRTGRPVRTPVCDGLDGDVFWLIAQQGRRADWVKNIQADPRVRVKVRIGSGVVWRAGTARIVDEDDPRERQRRIGEGNLARRLCVSASMAMATDPLTVRVDLDTHLPSASAQPRR
jgi:deazaflavin-dependent oxidoreductase (nitroreductase family)